MKKFTEYLREQGIELLPWQEQAAIDFLKNVEQNQGMASGKTFVVRMLFDFVQTHGNAFELDLSNATTEDNKMKNETQEKPSGSDTMNPLVGCNQNGNGNCGGYKRKCKHLVPHECGDDCVERACDYVWGEPHLVRCLPVESNRFESV